MGDEVTEQLPKELGFRRNFIGYITPSDEEFRVLWSDCLLVLDANILLHIFRFDRKIVEQFISLLEGLSDRIWVPYQAALEFYRNWRNVDAEARSSYDKVGRDLDADVGAIKSRFNTLVRYDLFDTSEAFKLLQSFLENTQSELIKCRDAHLSSKDTSKLLIRLQNIVGSNVGVEMEPDLLAAVYAEGVDRYTKKIPPGFNDAKKPEPDRCGDLVIWKSIISHSKQINNSVIFLTDDRKDDWWLEMEGKRVGPRPELCQEFLKENKLNFYMYSFSQFIEYASRFLGIELDQSLIADIEKSEEVRMAARENIVVVQNAEPASDTAYASEVRRLSVQRNELLSLYNQHYSTMSQIDKQIQNMQQEIIARPDTKSFLEPAITNLSNNLRALNASLITVASDLQINAQQSERANILGL